MPSCIVYLFSYQPGPQRNVAALSLQAAPIKTLVASRALEVVGQFGEHPKNRDRHFADTGAFRRAVAQAKQLGCPVVLGDVLDMLSRTHPLMIPDCVSTLSTAGVTILNAATGVELEAKLLNTMASVALIVATKRRRAGPVRKPQDRESGTSNQAKAARGSIHAADRRAERLRPHIGQIRVSVSAPLTPTLLARELNAREVYTDRGRLWSPTTARDLIKRLENIDGRTGNQS